MEVYYLKSINIQHSYELEASTVNQDSETTTDDEWFQKLTDFDIDEYFIKLLRNTD